jgi:dolichol kinase
VQGEIVVPSAAVNTAVPASAYVEDIHAPGMRPANYARNALHVTSATTALLILELAPSWGIAITIAASIAALGVGLEITRRLSPAINAACMTVFGRTAHAHEAHRVNSATWYAVAVLLMALCEQTVPAAIALVTLGVGDPLAAIVGRRFGKTPLVSGRTLEGSVTFVVSACIAAMAFVSIAHPDVAPGRALIAVIVGAVAGAVAELYSQRIDDNFSIPLASFAAAYLALAA